MKIIVVQYGQSYEVLILSSILIGLKKKFPKSKILWVGEPKYFQLVKFNKRINKCLDIHKSGDLVTLTRFYGSHICYNPSFNKLAQKFTSISGSKMCYGFNKDGPIDRTASFFQKVMSGQLSTHKTILDLYYDLANMKWKGEGYGLSYYPKTKKTNKVGINVTDNNTYCPNNPDEAEKFSLPDNLLSKFDVINQYSDIVTDDLFTAHAALALRKKVIFTKPLSYQLNFQSTIYHN